MIYSRISINLINKWLTILVVAFLVFTPLVPAIGVLAEESEVVEEQTEAVAEVTEAVSESSSETQESVMEETTSIQESSSYLSDSFLDDINNLTNKILSDPTGYADRTYERVQADDENEPDEDDAEEQNEAQQQEQDQENNESNEESNNQEDNTNNDNNDSQAGSDNSEQDPSGEDNSASQEENSDKLEDNSNSGGGGSSYTPEYDTPTTESLVGDSSDPDDILEYLREQREARYDERDVSTDDASEGSKTETTSANNDLEDCDDCEATSVTETDTGVVVENKNELAQENVTNGAANTGGVEVTSEKDILEARIHTGNSDLSSENTVEGNTTNVSSGGGGGGGSWIQKLWGTKASNSETDGDDNTSTAAAKEVKDLTIIQKDKAFISNIKDLLSLTGKNTINADGRCKDCLIDTGTALVKSNLLNIINSTTLGDSAFMPLKFDIFGNFNGNINVLDLLFEAFGRALDGPGLVTAKANNSAQDTDDSVQVAVAESIENINIIDEDQGYIFNDLNLSAITGRNRINAFSKVKDVAIKSGNAELVNNLVNILNNTLHNTRLGIVVINVFGEWNGSLIVPDAQQLANEIPNPVGIEANNNTTINNADDSFNQAVSIVNSNLDIVSEKVGDIDTQINVLGNTGNNKAIFEKDGEEIIENTGDITTLSNMLTLANRDVIGTAFSQTFVNTFGKWTGKILGASNARIEGNSSNFVVSSEAAAIVGGDAINAEVNNEAQDIDDNVQAGLAKVDKNVSVNNKDEGFIANYLNIEADTGNNDIVSYKGTKVLTDTGDISVANNIANFMNNFFSNSKGAMVLVNTFGEWRGNLAYSDFKDLAADVDLLSEPSLLDEQEEVAYEVSAINTGTQGTQEDSLTFVYDNSLLTLLDPAGGNTSGNSITWSIPALAAGEQQTFYPIFEVKDGLDDGRYFVSSLAKVRQVDDNPANNEETDEFSMDLGDISEYDIALRDLRERQARQGSSNSGSNSSNSSSNPENNAATNDQGTQEANTGSNNNENPAPETSNNDSNNSNNNSPSYRGGNSHTPGYLIVEKSVVETGPFKPGDQVDYILKVVNHGDTIINDVMVYDNLNKGELNAQESWPLQDVLEGETVTIGYHIVIPDNAEPGNYTNKAYASGFDGADAVVKSNIDHAVIVVENPNYTPSSDNSGGAVGSAGIGGVITEFNSGATSTASITSGGSPDNQAGNLASGESKVLSDEEISELEEEFEAQIRNTSRVSRYIPVASAAAGVYLNEKGEVLGLDDKSSAPSDKLAYAVYPNFLHFDGRAVEGSSTDYSSNWYSNWLIWILFILALIVGYLSYREKKKSRLY